MNEAPVFLLGVHKSGTSLLRSLLDGHPDLFVIPFESHFFQWMGNDILYPYRQQHQNASIETTTQRMVNWMEQVNTVADDYSDSNMVGKIDVGSFKTTLGTVDPKQEKAAFEGYVQAIHQALHQQPCSKRVVEKSVEHAEFAANIKQLYPNAKFIHIVRNPYSNLVSLRKFKTPGHFPSIIEVLNTLKIGYHFLYQNQRYLPHDYHVVKYEDLVQDPEGSIQQIASFLNIVPHENLLHPTSMGEAWEGNSMSGQKFTGIDASRLHRWKNDILPIEVYYANRMFSHVLNDWGYEPMPYSGGFWKRASKEKFKTYLRNRLYKIYL